jgi:hypothetical protein
MREILGDDHIGNQFDRADLLENVNRKEAAMWELICHHTYKWEGRPVDISTYNNPAEIVGRNFLSNGIAPASGALRFFTPSAHVRVFPGVAWNPIGAINVELTVRLTEPSTGSQTLIEGDNSFGVFVRDQKLFGYFVGKSIYPGMNSDGLNTYQDGVDFPGYRVPYGQWVVINFVHDGFKQMRLYVNGAPVTVARSVLAGVPPVGPKGICIGNSLGGGAPFGGDIDEVKVWRVDPYRDTKQFIARSADTPTTECWERFSASLSAALAKHPDCALKLTTDFNSIVDRLARGILDKGPETQQRFADVQKEFNRLWREGKIEGSEMQKLISDWVAWLRLIGVAIDTDPGVTSFGNSNCLKLVLDEIEGTDCDAKFAELLKLISKALRQSPAYPATAA